MENILEKEAGEELSTINYEVDTFTTAKIDEAVIIAAKSGDERAFEALFMGTYRYVFAAVRKYLKNDQDAYDAIQDTYSRVYKGLAHLESAASFYPWLHRIAENCAKDVLRLSGREILVPTDDLEQAATPEQREQGIDVAADVTDVLKQMPAEQVELLIRVYYDKMRISEIARMQGVPATTVYNRLKSAKKRLKELLKIRGIEKPIYSGEFISMVSIALRNAIGTELLSMAVAEEILHSVVKSANVKGAAIISRFARRERSRAALKIASLLLLSCLIISAAVIITVGIINKSLFGPDTPPDNSGSSVAQTDEDKEPSEEKNDETPSDTATKEDTNAPESPTDSTVDDGGTQPTTPSGIQDPFYNYQIDSSATLSGSFTDYESFGTHSEDGYLNIATTNDNIYAVVGNNLISAKKDSLKLGKIHIENFYALYGESGCFLNVFEDRVYWINQNSKGEFVLHRCNLDGSGHYTKVFTENGCTYVTDLLVASDGVYFLAGKQAGFDYRKNATLYRTDFDFEINASLEDAADFTIIKDNLYYLHGYGNSGSLYKADRATLQNREEFTPDWLYHGSLCSVGDYLVLAQYNKYAHTESASCTNLTIVDSKSGEIVRIRNGEGGEKIRVIDASDLDGGTLIYEHNGLLRTINITSGKIKEMETCGGVVYGKYKYFINNSSMYASELDSSKCYSIH